MVVTALASMYLFSVLGVKGSPNRRVFWIGGAGAVTMGLTGLMEIWVLAMGEKSRAHAFKRRERKINIPNKYKSKDRIEFSGVEGEMFVAGMV